MVKKGPGDCWDVVHSGPKKPGSKTDKPPGSLIKRFCGQGAEGKARAMHAAILISQAEEKD